MGNSEGAVVWFVPRRKCHTMCGCLFGLWWWEIEWCEPIGLQMEGQLFTMISYKVLVTSLSDSLNNPEIE